MSKSFRYVKEFEFGCGGTTKKYAKGGNVKTERVEKVSAKQKSSPNTTVREKSAMRMQKSESPLLPAIAMKKGGKCR